jgi:hypothetical protein
MPLNDPRDETWRRLRAAAIRAVLKRKGLMASEGVIASAAADESVERAWRRVAPLATTQAIRRPFWSAWLRRR